MRAAPADVQRARVDAEDEQLDLSARRRRGRSRRRGLAKRKPSTGLGLRCGHASAACTALAVASTPRMSSPPISSVVNKFWLSSKPLRSYQARFQSHPAA